MSTVRRSNRIATAIAKKKNEITVRLNDLFDKAEPGNNLDTRIQAFIDIYTLVDQEFDFIKKSEFYAPRYKLLDSILQGGYNILRLVQEKFETGKMNKKQLFATRKPVNNVIRKCERCE
jgi:hypothetical protein